VTCCYKALPAIARCCPSYACVPPVWRSECRPQKPYQPDFKNRSAAKWPCGLLWPPGGTLGGVLRKWVNDAPRATALKGTLYVHQTLLRRCGVSLSQVVLSCGPIYSLVGHLGLQETPTVLSFLSSQLCGARVRQVPLRVVPFRHLA